jgi:hypothetical protein
MHRISLLLGLTLMGSQGFAASWTHFADCGSPGQQRFYWYDASSVTPRGSAKLVSIQGDYSHVLGSPTAKVRMLWSVDCQSGTVSEKRRTEYRPNGTVLVDYRKTTKPSVARPETVAGKLLNSVCS